MHFNVCWLTGYCHSSNLRAPQRSTFKNKFKQEIYPAQDCGTITLIYWKKIVRWKVTTTYLIVDKQLLSNQGTLVQATERQAWRGSYASMENDLTVINLRWSTHACLQSWTKKPIPYGEASRFIDSIEIYLIICTTIGPTQFIHLSTLVDTDFNVHVLVLTLSSLIAPFIHCVFLFNSMLLPPSLQS